jgi:hypothetical protein
MSAASEVLPRVTGEVSTLSQRCLVGIKQKIHELGLETHVRPELQVQLVQEPEQIDSSFLMELMTHLVELESLHGDEFWSALREDIFDVSTLGERRARGEFYEGLSSGSRVISAVSEGVLEASYQFQGDIQSVSGEEVNTQFDQTEHHLELIEAAPDQEEGGLEPLSPGHQRFGAQDFSDVESIASIESLDEIDCGTAFQTLFGTSRFYRTPGGGVEEASSSTMNSEILSAAGMVANLPITAEEKRTVVMKAAFSATSGQSVHQLRDQQGRRGTVHLGNPFDLPEARLSRHMSAEEIQKVLLMKVRVPNIVVRPLSRYVKLQGLSDDRRGVRKQEHLFIAHRMARAGELEDFSQAQVGSQVVKYVILECCVFDSDNPYRDVNQLIQDSSSSPYGVMKLYFQPKFETNNEASYIRLACLDTARSESLVLPGQQELLPSARVSLSQLASCKFYGVEAIIEVLDPSSHNVYYRHYYVNSCLGVEFERL